MQKITINFFYIRHVMNIGIKEELINLSTKLTLSR